MKTKCRFIPLLVSFLISTISLKAQNKWYVDGAATGANNGSNWANAFHLSDATNAARSSATTDTIFVAAGNYYPTGAQSSTNADSAFIFTRSNLAVLGGYPSGGGMISDWVNNPTILSGNIGNAGITSDNSYHVIVAVGTSGLPITNTLKLDGFTI